MPGRGGGAVDVGQDALCLFDKRAVQCALQLHGQGLALPEGSLLSSPMVTTSASAWTTTTSVGAMFPVSVPNRFRAPMTC